MEIRDQRPLDRAPGRRLQTRVAGRFLFLPRLARLRLETRVEPAGDPGSRSGPAGAALVSLLGLKLLDTARRRPINDCNCDAALGLCAGRNILPQKSYATAYSDRPTGPHQERLLAGSIAGLTPRVGPPAQAFCRDFPPIPYRGDPHIRGNHYRPVRGRAGPSVLTCFTHEPTGRVLCDAKAHLTRADQPGELRRFVAFWHRVTGRAPQGLDCDSQLVPSAALSRVHQRGIHFVPIRRRGAAWRRR